MRKRVKCGLLSLALLFLFGILSAVRPISVNAATNLVADISSYQSSDLAFFQKLKQQGVKAVIVKLTQGDWYLNPKAAQQIANAKKAGLLVNAYHYAEFNSSRSSGSPAAEAQFFVKEAKALGVESDRVLALDIEDGKNSSNPSVITKDINTFNDYVHTHGYSYTSTYSMRSWFSSNRIQFANLHDKNLWIAEYGSSAVGFQPCGAWQFTSTWAVSGYGKIDMSYDYDNRFTTSNKANLDNFAMDGQNIQITGWHANNQTIGHNYRFLIVMDAQTNKELKRVPISSVSRPDVHRIYSNIYNSINSGFKTNVKVDSKLAGKKVFVISRYSTDSSGNSNYVDYWFRDRTLSVPSQSINNENKSHLDEFTASESSIQAKGWHINNKTVGLNYRYLVIMNADTNKEIKRVRISSVSRPDVYRVYSNIYNSINGGFNQSISVDNSLSGKRIFVIDRYTSDPSGNSNYVDYWFRSQAITVPVPAPVTPNKANLDNLAVNGLTLQATGWHASNTTVGHNYRYLLIMDAATNSQLKRVPITSVSRPDVYRVYSNIYNSINSGFRTSVNLDSTFIGKNIFVIDRYTSDPAGNANYVDYWFRNQTVKVLG